MAVATLSKHLLKNTVTQQTPSVIFSRPILTSRTQTVWRPSARLADFLEVDGKYESVVDEFLRDELNYIVVKSWDAADAGMHLLQTDVTGRATFLVHPNDAQANFPFAEGMKSDRADQH